MTRIIPYQPAELADPADLVAAIRRRRGGRLLNLDRMLLHSPALAQGWNGFLSQVRQHLSLNGRWREMAMCGVAILNGAEYEFIQHAPVFLKEGGSNAELAWLRRLGTPDYDPSCWPGDVDRRVCDLIIQMTRHIQVDDSVKRDLQATLGNQALVELVGVVSTYNMVSRFLVALDVHPE